jgi:hypothetical protein
LRGYGHRSQRRRQGEYAEYLHGLFPAVPPSEQRARPSAEHVVSRLRSHKRIGPG